MSERSFDVDVLATHRFVKVRSRVEVGIGAAANPAIDCVHLEAGSGLKAFSELAGCIAADTLVEKKIYRGVFDEYSPSKCYSVKKSVRLG